MWLTALLLGARWTPGKQWIGKHRRVLKMTATRRRNQAEREAQIKRVGRSRQSSYTRCVCTDVPAFPYCNACVILHGLVTLLSMVSLLHLVCRRICNQDQNEQGSKDRMTATPSCLLQTAWRFSNQLFCSSYFDLGHRYFYRLDYSPSSLYTDKFLSCPLKFPVNKRNDRLHMQTKDTKNLTIFTSGHTHAYTQVSAMLSQSYLTQDEEVHHARERRLEYVPKFVRERRARWMKRTKEAFREIRGGSGQNTFPRTWVISTEYSSHPPSCMRSAPDPTTTCAQVPTWVKAHFKSTISRLWISVILYNSW